MFISITCSIKVSPIKSPDDNTKFKLVRFILNYRQLFPHYGGS